MASEPNAVTIQDSSEIAPTWAMFDGNMMMPEPIMLTITMKVSCTTFIFFCDCAMASASECQRGRVHAPHALTQSTSQVLRPFLSTSKRRPWMSASKPGKWSSVSRANFR